MIPYHQSQDLMHCCFRICCIMNDSRIAKMEYDKVRILDFLTVFPRVAASMRLPSTLRHVKKVFEKAPESYERIPSAQRILDSMSDIHMSAIRSLVSLGLFSADTFSSSGQLAVMDGSKDVLVKLSERNNEKKEPWYQAIVLDLATIGLLGPDGLKARTGLLEYRYDVA